MNDDDLPTRALLTIGGTAVAITATAVIAWLAFWRTIRWVVWP